MRWLDLPLEQVLRMAAPRDLRVLVEFSTTWCSVCIRMDQDVFRRPEAGRALHDRRVLAVRLDAEAEAGRPLADRYAVVAYPTLLLLDGRGRELDRIVGSVSLEQLLAWLDGPLAAPKDAKDRPDGPGEGQADPALLLELGEAEALGGKFGPARRHLSEVVRLDPQNARGLAARALLVLAKYVHLRGQKENRAALVVLEELVRRFPGSPEAAAAPFHSAMAYHALGDDARALAVLREAVSARPDSPDPVEALGSFALRTGVGVAEAQAAVEAGVERFPGNAPLWSVRALLLKRTGRPDEARAAIQRAVALEPEDSYLRWLASDLSGDVGGCRAARAGQAGSSPEGTGGETPSGP